MALKNSKLYSLLHIKGTLSHFDIEHGFRVKQISNVESQSVYYIDITATDI